MKILLDAFPLLAPKSGVGYYTYHLLHALQRRYATQDEFVYFYGRRFTRTIAESPPVLDAAARRTLKRILQDPYRFTQPIKELLFRIGTRFIKPDLYHETNYVLLPFKGPQVVTVFDLSVKRFPETHPAGRVRFFNDYFDRRLPRARHIIAISEFTKRELMEVMGVPADKITVTPLAPPPGFARPSEDKLAKFRAAHELDEPFLLYLGNLEPRKNLIMLVRAYAQFIAYAGSTAPMLVLAGEQTWLSEPLIDEIERLGLRSRVMLPGYVAEADLPCWYAAAQAFLYPSKYEGFGLPVVEAMAVGTPVLAADAASLPEVAGDAAMLLPPDNCDAWAGAMTELTNAASAREVLGRKGIARAAQFSWDRCAEITHAVYEQATQ